jgi:peroxiredoxin Q/BCP
LPFRLLTDRDQQVARKYGSRSSSGYPRRTVFVIDPAGRIAYRNMQFDAMDPDHYAKLGAAVRTARGS